MCSFRWRAFPFFSGLATTFVFAGWTSADTVSKWNGGNGNWSSAGQWTPAVVPNNGGGQIFDVTIAGGTVALDTSPTINALNLQGGGLGTGVDPTDGLYTTLTVNGNVMVGTSGGIGGNPSYGWSDSLAVGGSMTNNGNLSMGNGFTVSGNLRNSGSLSLLIGGSPGFVVGGSLINTGSVYWGSQDGTVYGTPTSLGSFINRGTAFIGVNSDVSVTNGIKTIPTGASWTIAGSFNGFTALTSTAGTLDLQNAITLGSAGSTVQNTGSIRVGNNYNGPGPINVTVAGNLKNAGSIVIGDNGPSFLQPGGPTSLTVNGTFTNQATGTLDVRNADNAIVPSPGSLNAQRFINRGTAQFSSGTISSAQFVQNFGTLNIAGDQFGDIGELITNTLSSKAGTIAIGNNGGTLIVGSGTVAPGTTGYVQLANGTLDEGGGTVSAATASLNGTLDVMLGQAAKPVGTVFDILTTPGGTLSGTFSTVNGLIFDGGRQRYILDYDYTDGIVSLTVANNIAAAINGAGATTTGFAGTATPEPATVGFTGLGLLAFPILRRQRARSRSWHQ